VQSIIDEPGRRQTMMVRKKDARSGDAARRQCMTSPSSEGAEESNQDSYRDEGGLEAGLGEAPCSAIDGVG
jgi:hypothetical protein